MRPPWVGEAPAASLGAGRARRRLPWPRFRRGSAALSALAAVVLAGSVTVGIHLQWQRIAPPTSWAHTGTAFLGIATCADWQDAGAAQRLTIVGALASAATGPDPENSGATLTDGQAFLLFNRACSTSVSRSFLLYEIYNRAAVFHRGPGPSVPAGGAYSGALGH